MTMRPAASESPRGSPPKASSSPSRGVNLAPSSSSSSALTPDQEATVQEAVMEQLMNYGEGMVSKEHRATLAEYAACVLQTQTTVSEMVSEMEQFLQGNAESFVEWLITFCESHGLAHPERKATKATPRGGGLFSKALRAATGQPPAGSSGPATASNGASPTGGAGGLLTGSGKKRGAEDESCSPDGANKIARREMRAIAQQADAVNANRAFTPLGSHNESRHPVRLVGRKELNQRAVATVRRSLGESPAGERSSTQSAAEGALGPLVRSSPPPAAYQPPLRRASRAQRTGGLPPVTQQPGGGYVAQVQNGVTTATTQPPPPPLPPPTQPQPRQASFTVPPVTTPQRNEDGYKWRAVREDALVRATCEPDSAPVASITNGEIVEQCGQRIVLQSGIIRIQIRHPSHPSFPAPLGWVTLTAEAAGGVRYFEKGPDKVRYSDSPTSVMYGGKGGKGKGKGKGKGAMASGYYAGSFSPSWAGGYSGGYHKPGYSATGYYYGGYKGRGGKGAFAGATGAASFGNIKWTPPSVETATEAQR